MRTAHRLFVFALVSLALMATSHAFAQGGGPSVLRIEIDGVITPVVADHVADAVERAEDEGHEALLVQLDTPGGLVTAMRDIVQAFLNADLPVLVWVGPAGARATSAGAIISLAADVVGMAPGTNIGAATPVSIEGGEVGDKITNDAAAYAEAIAEEQGRDTDFAREIVEDGRSEPASDAVEIGAVDLVADDESDVLAQVDELPDEVTIVDHEMGWVSDLRQRLADPNLAYLFMSIGTLAIIYELINPGVGFGGIIGVILLALGLFGLAVLPVNLVGILLLLLAAGLFVAEVFVPGIGVFAAGGAIALTMSAIFLVRGSLSVSPAVFLPTAIVVGGGAILAGRLTVRAHRSTSSIGPESLIGRSATVSRQEGHQTQVFLEGTWWAVAADAPLEHGQPVRITEVQGLRLKVEPTTEEGS